MNRWCRKNSYVYIIISALVIGSPSCEAANETFDYFTDITSLSTGDDFEGFINNSSLVYSDEDADGPFIPKDYSYDPRADEDDAASTPLSFTEAVMNAEVMEGLEVDLGRRRLQSCTSFENSPRNPGSKVVVAQEPWKDRPYTCKLLVTFPNRGNFVCSGSLVGPFHLITARHCTYHPCFPNITPTVRVSCGYGYHPDTNEYAHFGSATVVGCYSYSAHDNAATCGPDGESFIGAGRRYDIQLCRLDRSVGDFIGFFGHSDVSATSIQVRGYPGDSRLQPWYPNALNQRFDHFETASTSSTAFVYQLNGAWIFGGESGCPYANAANQVLAVHSGGPSGCTEFGTRITTSVNQDILALKGITPTTSTLQAWPTPSPYCQVVNYPVDLFDSYNGDVIGLAPATTAADGSAGNSITVQSGTTFQVRLTMFNVGNAAANLEVRIYASTNDAISASDSLLDTSTLTLNPFSRFRRIRTVQANWGPGARYIGVMWVDSSCKTDNGNTAVVGLATASTSPIAPVPRPTPAPIRPVPPPTLPPTPSEPTTLPPAFGGICFSGLNTVEVQKKGIIRIDQLKIGDFVKTSTTMEVPSYSRVYSFAHIDRDIESSFLQIHTEGSHTPLEISFDHMLFLGNNKVVRAGDVRVGDIIGNDNKKVSHVDVIQRHGLYAPVTESGDIIVSGVRASSYVALIDVAPSLQTFATHALMTPHRLVCSVRFSICEMEEYTEDGLSKYLVSMIKAATVVAELDHFMQLLLMLVGFPLLILFLALEYLTYIPALIFVILVSVLAKPLVQYPPMLTRCPQKKLDNKSLA